MPETAGQEDCTELVEIIRERIAEKGRMTFAEYMGLCLYDPKYGYYAAPRQRIGRGGDFFTSSSVHALFGRLICRQLHEMWQLLGSESFTVVEQGAGEGHLCLDILDEAQRLDPRFYDNLCYVLVEIGADGRERQQRLLEKHISTDRIRWSSLDDLQGLEGCFLSNELVDAFPVHLVEQTAEGLQEIYVGWSDDGPVEVLDTPSTPDLAAYFARLDLTLAEGNRAEVNLGAVRWMESVAAVLKRGFAITIDYGYPAQELFAPLRKTGTLMCYRKHQAHEDPFQNIGCQDITSHVDFTTLQKVGAEHGLETLFFGPQYRFLMGLGFVQSLMEMEAQESDPDRARALRMTLKNLIMPEAGMGETFKVLVQGKNVDAAQLACQRPLSEVAFPMGAL